ncbi:MAG: polysaccharide deacetylase family protein [Ignavibacteriales bacterium]
MKKQRNAYRRRLIALILAVLMLLPFISKDKKGLATKMEYFYHKYFTEDNSGTVTPDLKDDNDDIFPTESNNIDAKEDIMPTPITNTEVETPINSEAEPSPTPVVTKPEESKVEPKNDTKPDPTKNEAVVETTKKVAFTFDDGPSKYTEELLAILKENNAEATFFILGSKIDQYASTIEDIKDGGHQIGSHGVSHSDFTKMTNEKLIKELEATKSLLAKYNITQTLVRPPYGNVNKQVKESVDYPLIMWSIDTRDWESRNSKSEVQIIIENIEDGSIIIMHDVYKPTIDAVKMVLPLLKEKGYEFVTIDELFGGSKLEDGKQYYKKK